jgi:hypothetical protein
MKRAPTDHAGEHREETSRIAALRVNDSFLSSSLELMRRTASLNASAALSSAKEGVSAEAARSVPSKRRLHERRRR